jgi:hypothetical protein
MASLIFFVMKVCVDSLNHPQIRRKLNKGQISIIKLNDDIIIKATFEIFLYCPNIALRSLIVTFLVNVIVSPINILSFVSNDLT